MLRPIIGPLVNAPLRGVTEAGVGASLSAFSAAKFAIEQDSTDVNILVIGDSTGNETTEWVYLFGQWLASEYTTHSVSYRLWNDGTNVYDAAVSLGAGSGGNTVRIWNASVSGANPRHLMGAKFSAAIGALSPNVVIWNHGHNLVNGVQNRGKFLEAIEQVKQAKPTAGHVYLRQNPNRDDSNMDAVIAALGDVSSDYGDLRLADAYSAFVAAGKPAGWYADNIHPSATGQSLGMLPAVQALWRSSASSSGFTPAPAFLNTTATNLLGNGDFSDFAGALPTFWSQGGNGTISKELAIVDGASPWSVKVVNGTASTDIRQSVTATAYRGQMMTAAVRQRVASGGTSNTGRVRIFSNGTSPPFEANDAGTVGVDGFKWTIVSGFVVPNDATAVTVALYGDGGNTAGGTAYYDRAILVVGDIPRDMA